MGLPPLEPQLVDFHDAKPQLVVVVDTEEEFDWTLPFDRSARGTVSIPAQDRLHRVYDRLGVKPTYVIDHPVATSAAAVQYLRGLVDSGRAGFGTHCHPWVTPPHSEAVSVFHSFHGNLPEELEAAKLRNSTDAVAQAFGQAPRIFKAGRYGVGPNTFKIIRDLGYTVDCSFVPATSWMSESGPCFYGTPDQPFFTNSSRELLEVPLTVGFSGLLGRHAGNWAHLMDSPILKRLHIPGASSRLRLIERARLSPEGFDAQTQIRLLDALIQQGKRVFTLSYHSTTLMPGVTPYVRSEADLGEFVLNVEAVLTHFQTVHKGRFTTLEDIEMQARTAAASQIPTPHRFSSKAASM